MMIEKINIRAIQKSDRKLLANYANNIRVSKNLRDAMPFPYTLEDADNFIEIVRFENPLQTFAIALNKKFIGVCGLNLQSDIYRKSCEVGYWVAEPYWGKGVATKALKLLTSYAFEELKMERVFTGVFEYNVASQKVLFNCGYKKEGVFRKALIKDGRLYDEVRYACLK